MSKLPFLILRNHENLPTKWDNDVDILVAPEDLKIAHSIVLQAMEMKGGCGMIQVMLRANFCGTKRRYHDRELQIDLYSKLSKAWACYANTKAILAARSRAHALFDIPDPLHELLLIAAKELFSYGAIRQRYHARLIGKDPKKVSEASSHIFSNEMTKSGVVFVSRALSDPTLRGRPRLKIKTLLLPHAAWSWARMRRNNWTVWP